MRLPWRPGDRRVFFAAVLVALLAVLGGFQWRWLEQVNRSERQRLRSNLRAAADAFTDAFDRELTHAFSNFHVPPGPSSARAARLQESVREWQRTARHRRLLKDVYLAEREPDGAMTLRRHRADTGTLESAAWPLELRDLQQRLEHGPRSGGRDGEPPRPPAPYADEVPALVVPLEPTPGSDRPHIQACAILVLDLAFVTQELFPELTARFFVATSGVDGRIAVVRKEEPGRALFRSDPTLPLERMGEGDVRADLFSLRGQGGQEEPRGPRLEERGRMLRSDADRQPPRRGFDDEGGPDRRGGWRDRRAPPDPVDERDRLGPPDPGGSRDRGEDPPPERAAYSPPARADAPPGRERAGGRWQLIVSHRAGSLENAVAGLHRYNLAMSFGIFVLLGLSGTMLVVSTQRAERLARQQIEFVAGVSHELRTPIAAMRSAGQNLADGVVKEPDAVRRYGSLVDREGRRLTEMVEKILEFAGMQSGQRIYQLRALSESGIAEVIEAALAACRGMAEEAGARLTSELAPNLPDVDADPEALRRVLQNLLENAVKYGGPDGVVTLSARREGSSLALSVSDRGRGIRESERAHLFTPFYRGRDAARSSPGTGLGLSLVKEIVEAHHGRVSIEKGEGGRGSRFTVRLPARKSA
ncbi:MAG: HAMP domain-containing sensor histidine kinase [Thermoanaerobaculia bacterium]